jgi:hypothetical protein
MNEVTQPLCAIALPGPHQIRADKLAESLVDLRLLFLPMCKAHWIPSPTGEVRTIAKDALYDEHKGHVQDEKLGVQAFMDTVVWLVHQFLDNAAASAAILRAGNSLFGAEVTLRATIECGALLDWLTDPESERGLSGELLARERIARAVVFKLSDLEESNKADFDGRGTEAYFRETANRYGFSISGVTATLKGRKSNPVKVTIPKIALAVKGLSIVHNLPQDLDLYRLLSAPTHGRLYRWEDAHIVGHSGTTTSFGAPIWDLEFNLFLVDFVERIAFRISSQVAQLFGTETAVSYPSC